MDLRMPSGDSAVAGEPLNLDPIALDSSGDGILDNETVEIDYRTFQENNETKIEATVTEAKHHPNRTDTTGDGLTDREQLEGWEISVIDDRENALSLLDPESDHDLVDLFETRNVTANPLLNDTAGNGLHDAEERELGTDPERADTTGDGINDQQALSDPLEDPTVFTVTAPKVTPIRSDRQSEWGSFERPYWYFSFYYQIEDTAGVAEWEVIYQGEVKDQRTYAGPTHVTDRTTFQSTSAGALEALRGSQTDIAVTDVNNNSQTDLLHQEHAFYSELSTMGVPSKQAGQLSGFTHGFGGLADFAILLKDEHVHLIPAVVEFIAGLDQELIAAMISNLPQTAYDAQDRANPHEAPDDDPQDVVETCFTDNFDLRQSTDYCEFAHGWYNGQAAFAATETVLSGGVAKGASSTNDVSRTLRTAENRLENTPRTDGRVTRTQANSQQVMTDGGRHVEDIDAPKRTAGGNARAVHLLGGVDNRILDELSPSQKQQLGRQLADSSDSGATVRLVNELDASEVRYLLEADDVVMTSRLAQMRDRGTINADDVNRLARGLDEGTIDSTTVRSGLSQAAVLSNQGYNPTALRVGQEANTRDPYYTVRYDDEFTRGDLVDGQVPDSYRPNEDLPGYNPPHEPNGIVIEAETTRSQSYIRVHREEGNQQGPWMMNEDEFIDVATREGRSGLERTYALPDVPEYATRVTIPEGENVRVSTAGPQDDLPGGGTQTEIRRFDDELENEWFAPEPEDLSEYIGE